MLEQLKEILYENTGLDIDITNQTDLKNDLGLNSLDLANLACDVEEAFDVEIPDSELKNIKTVGDVIELIENNI